MTIRYRVELSEAEQQQRITTVSRGKHAARKIKQTQILPTADSGIIK